MLTSYDGHTITYDAIGNMLNDGERTYEWQAGRQLKKVTMRCTEEECKACEPGTDGGDTKLVIEFDSLNVLEGNVTSVTARAEVYNGATPVTESIPASHFTWTRNSGDAAADAIWNAQNNGTKQVTVNRSNLTGNVSISCTVQAVESYGTVHVDDTLMASHTPAVSDANDEFGIVNGDLKVDTNKAEGSYILDNGQVRITGVTLGGDLTANAMVFTAWPNKTVEFNYNADGLRTQKKVTVGNIISTTDYILHGKLVTEMRRGNDVLHFYYDTHNQPSICECNGQKMIYVHNLQGDIVAIVDSDGAKVVEYRYDAWGRDIGRTLTSDIGELNPFRYRGYVYDEETGLYYLRSRYYDPEMGRFACIDGSCELCLNSKAYSYCNNLSSILYDDNGYSSKDALLQHEIPYNDALSVTFNSGNRINIEVYLTITGDVDDRIVYDGIMDYWNAKIPFNNSIISITTNVHIGNSPNGNTITIQTSEGSGITQTICTANSTVQWASGYSKVLLYRHYEDGSRKSDNDMKWSIAHEFGHVLGIADYYIEKGHYENYHSIMNKRNMTVSLADVIHVVAATITKGWVTWRLWIRLQHKGVIN